MDTMSDHADGDHDHSGGDGKKMMMMVMIEHDEEEEDGAEPPSPPRQGHRLEGARSFTCRVNIIV
jgi:hypothetical protein